MSPDRNMPYHRSSARRARMRRAATLLGLLVTTALLGVSLARLLAPGRGRPAHRVPPRAGAAVFTVLDREGLGAALSALQRLAAADSVILRDGHQIAHALGREAAAAEGSSGSVITECNPTFASGCYHGVVEALLQTRGGVDMGMLERMCRAAGSPDRPGPIYECVHGLGHGVLGAVRLDAAAALRHCDALASPAFAASCRSGVFMEAINAAVGHAGVPARPAGHEAHGVAAHHQGVSGALALDAGNPYAPCDGFDGEYGTACWLFQGFVILRATGFDARTAFETCNAAPGGRAGDCYESLGHQLTGLFQRGDRWIVEQCEMGQPELAPRCAGGAALALSGADWSGRRTAQFCSAAPPDWRKECYRAASALLAQLASPGDAAWFCARVREAGVGECATQPPASRRPRS